MSEASDLFGREYLRYATYVVDGVRMSLNSLYTEAKNKGFPGTKQSLYLIANRAGNREVLTWEFILKDREEHRKIGKEIRDKKKAEMHKICEELDARKKGFTE